MDNNLDKDVEQQKIQQHLKNTFYSILINYFESDIIDFPGAQVEINCDPNIGGLWWDSLNAINMDDIEEFYLFMITIGIQHDNIIHIKGYYHQDHSAEIDYHIEFDANAEKAFLGDDYKNIINKYCNDLMYSYIKENLYEPDGFNVTVYKDKYDRIFFNIEETKEHAKERCKILHNNLKEKCLKQIDLDQLNNYIQESTNKCKKEANSEDLITFINIDGNNDCIIGSITNNSDINKVDHTIFKVFYGYYTYRSDNKADFINNIVNDIIKYIENELTNRNIKWYEDGEYYKICIPVSDSDIDNYIYTMKDFIHVIDDSSTLYIASDYDDINDFFDSNFEDNDSINIVTEDTNTVLITIEKLLVNNKEKFRFIVDITNDTDDEFKIKTTFDSQEKFKSLVEATISALKEYKEFYKYAEDLEKCL